MKLVRKLKYAGPAMLLSLLFAAPAFAQFEVSPDHFDSQPTAKEKPAPKSKARQARQDGSKQPADGRTSTNAAVTATNSASNPASRPAGQANATTTTAPASVATAKQSQGKNRTSQHLSARANPVPRE
jgi:hypothetical protein